MEELNKEEFFKLVEKANIEYFSKRPCRFCVGNGCDDCRDCPDAVTAHQMWLESEFEDVLDEIIIDEFKSIYTSIEELENGKLTEENIVLYAQILNNNKPKNKRDDSDYFNRPAKELIL